MPQKISMPQQILMGESAGEMLSPLLKNRKAFFLFDQNSNLYCKSKIPTGAANYLVLNAGDETKNLSNCEKIWQFLLDHKADKNSVIVNVGGGMICDLGGFCASVYKRGIAFIHVPTTLLAMVDAAIGGKTAINLSNRKNMLGTTTQPEHIIFCTEFLDTLPHEEWQAGYAEIIKHAIISGDMLFESVTHGFPDADNHLAWNKIIDSNIRIKSEISVQDPFDTGIRQVLNLGHTAAHALEAFGLENGQHISHGHAVAAGIIIESTLSNLLGHLKKEEKETIVSLVDKHFSRVIFGDENISSIIKFAFDDKKNINGQLTFSLPFAVGDVRFGIQCSTEDFTTALQEYLK